MILMAIIVFSILMGYFYYFEKNYQTTPGKRWMGLKIIELGDVNYWTRNFWKFSPLNFISFFMNQNAKFTHDIKANTEVIESKL